MLNILSCVCWQSVYLLWRNVCLGLSLSFNLDCFFSYYWVLRVHCIFWSTVFHHICLCKCFLPVCSLFFYSLEMIFCRTEFFIMKFSLSVISLVDCVFGVVSKTTLLDLRSSKFSSTLSSRSFLVLHYTYSSMIHTLS